MIEPSTTTKYLAVWIDHKEARIFHIDSESSEETTVLAPLESIHHKHPKGPAGFKEHPDDAAHFFQEVLRALAGTESILVVGPSTAKLDFHRYAHKHDHAIDSRIVAVETVDHPSDRQVVAYAKKYFKLEARTDVS